MREIVLLHSPLVGPGFWRPTAEALEAHGWRCHTPSVAGHASEPARWRDLPAAVCRALEVAPGAVLAGHSAAGFLLPAVARRIGGARLIFVDASIPPASGCVPPADAQFLRFVEQLPVEDGRLPPWSQWWGAGAIERVINDAERHQRFEAELPRLSRAWFEDAVEVPDWVDLPAGYLRTSERFAATALDARRRGWPVQVIAGTHLHPYVAPDETARALATLVEALE